MAAPDRAAALRALLGAYEEMAKRLDAMGHEIDAYWKIHRAYLEAGEVPQGPPIPASLILIELRAVAQFLDDLAALTADPKARVALESAALRVRQVKRGVE